RFLLRHGVQAPQGTRRWSRMFLRWLDTLSFPHRATQVASQEYLHAVHELQGRVERLKGEIHAMATESRQARVIQALQAIKGVQEVTAVSLVAEIGEFSRFGSAAELMAYAGLVPRGFSSGAQTRRGGITKTGNGHVRFVLGEAAWAYRHRPAVKAPLRARQQGAYPDVLRVALKAQERLQRKYWRLLSRGKPSTVAATAVARELLGFAWAIGCCVEAKRTHAAA
ncbi:MAG: transposase, partial [Bacillota bacterium]